MKFATRISLAISLALCGLFLAVTPASAQDPRIPLTPQDPTILEGYCPGFTVVLTFTRFNQYIVRSSTSDEATTLLITGTATVTATNQSTGKSVSYNISGPGTVVQYPDGSFSLDLKGPNLLYTLSANLKDFPDVPTLSYTHGRVTVAVAGDGQTTAYSLRGNRTDVCEVLATP
jgi:hypothetical protein